VEEVGTAVLASPECEAAFLSLLDFLFSDLKDERQVGHCAPLFSEDLSG
jgi:hypothetical protein